MVYLSGLQLFGLCLAAVALATLVAPMIQTRLSPRRPPQMQDDPAQAIFLFDDDTLLDASAGARRILNTAREGETDLARFLAWGEPRFAGLRAGIHDLRQLGAWRASSEAFSLLAEWRSGLIRITVHEGHLDPPFRSVDVISEQSREEELEAHRHLAEAAPIPIWTQDPGGRILWANAAYVALANRQADPDEEVSWPLPIIFPDPKGGARAEISVGKEVLWYDLQMAEREGARSFYAIPAQALVQAERALRAFVQTLTRTFSYLPIGLAMFDSQRKLHLFNPALTDLTTLPVDFLATRPNLNTFLDRLRERGIIPEPTDYAAWRAKITSLDSEQGASDFEEVWSLQSGLTYRVIARPHPEGMLVLLLQDISDEIASIRRMKADLNLGQSVIDASPEAVAVFAASGQLILTNRAYADLWGNDPSQNLRKITLADLLSDWQYASTPNPFWDRIEGYVGRSTARNPEETSIWLLDGRLLDLRLAPLAGGATLVGFRTDDNAMPDYASKSEVQMG